MISKNEVKRHETQRNRIISLSCLYLVLKRVEEMGASLKIEDNVGETIQSPTHMVYEVCQKESSHN
jgi:hypothetical protein